MDVGGDFESFFAIAGGRHLVISRPENRPHEASKANVVIDNEDCVTAGVWF
jgi:hypothetical protein